MRTGHGIIPSVIQRTPGTGRYARFEREQRWILGGLPSGLADPVEVQDRYLNDSTLRLRCVESGPDAVYKLGQKVRVMPNSPALVSMTNLYLTRREFEALGALKGSSLHKTRWHWSVGDRILSVDQFNGDLDGLILAEVELQEDDSYLVAPSLAVADVTDDDRFSGGNLAHLSTEAAATLVNKVAELVRIVGESDTLTLSLEQLRSRHLLH